MSLPGRRKDGLFARSAKGRLVDALGRLERASSACGEKAAR